MKVTIKKQREKSDNSIIVTTQETYSKIQLPSKTTASNYHKMVDKWK